MTDLSLTEKAEQAEQARTKTGLLLAEAKKAMSKANTDKQKASTKKAIDQALTVFKQAAINELSARRMAKDETEKASNEKANEQKASEQAEQIKGLNEQAENVLKGLSVDKAFDIVNAYQAFELDCLNQAIVIEYLDNEASKKADICKAFFERLNTEGLNETIVSKVLMIRTELVKAIESRPLYQQAIEAIQKAVDKQALTGLDKIQLIEVLSFYVIVNDTIITTKSQRKKAKGEKGHSSNNDAVSREQALAIDNFKGDRGLLHNRCLSIAGKGQQNYETEKAFFENNQKFTANYEMSINKIRSICVNGLLIEIVTGKSVTVTKKAA